MTTYSTGETTKQKLINAAGMLAAERGLDNVSTRAVADVSGENIGSIHYHFGGKDGLFKAVIRDAMDICLDKEYFDAIDSVDATSTPEEFSKVVRMIVQSEINDLFRSDRPVWHSQVIYQLFQRDDDLYEMFRAKVLEPGLAAFSRFLKIVKPGLDDEEIFQRTIIMRTPIFSHANYMKVFLKALGAKSYSEDYLRKLEDLLVGQTQLSLGLPED